MPRSTNLCSLSSVVTNSAYVHHTIIKMVVKELKQRFLSVFYVAHLILSRHITISQGCQHNSQTKCQYRIYLTKPQTILHRVNYSHPPTYVFGPRPSILSGARKFVRTMPKMSWSCQIPKIRSWRSTIFLKIRSKTPLKKLRNLSLGLRTGPWRFQSWQRGLDLRTLESGCLRTSIRMSSEGITRMPACLPACLRVLKVKMRSLSTYVVSTTSPVWEVPMT